MAYGLIRPTVWYGLRSGMAYGLVWPMVYGRVWPTVGYGLRSGMAYGLVWPMVWYGLWSGMAYGWSGLWSGMASGLVWPLVWYGLWFGMGYELIRPMVWYGLWSGMDHGLEWTTVLRLVIAYCGGLLLDPMGEYMQSVPAGDLEAAFGYIEQGKHVPLNVHSEFLSWVKQQLSLARLDAAGCSGHSFRRGVAAFSSLVRLLAFLIQAMGAWRIQVNHVFLGLSLQQKLDVHRKQFAAMAQGQWGADCAPTVSICFLVSFWFLLVGLAGGRPRFGVGWVVGLLACWFKHLGVCAGCLLHWYRMHAGPLLSH